MRFITWRVKRLHLAPMSSTQRRYHYVACLIRCVSRCQEAAATRRLRSVETISLPSLIQISSILHYSNTTQQYYTTATSHKRVISYSVTAKHTPFPPPLCYYRYHRTATVQYLSTTPLTPLQDYPATTAPQRSKLANVAEPAHYNYHADYTMARTIQITVSSCVHLNAHRLLSKYSCPPKLGPCTPENTC